MTLFLPFRASSYGINNDYSAFISPRLLQQHLPTPDISSRQLCCIELVPSHGDADCDEEESKDDVFDH